MKTSFNNISDIDLRIKFSPNKGKWLAYSFLWEEIYIENDSLEKLFEDIQNILKGYGNDRIEVINQRVQARRVITKVIVKSELFIHSGLTAVFRNRKEKTFWIYFPKWESGFEEVEIEKYQLDSDDSGKIENSLKKIKSTNIPASGDGLDGRMYSLRIGGGLNSVEYVWWSDSAGDQWTPLYELRDLINELVKKYRKE